MIYYAYSKDGERVPGYTDPKYKNGYPTIEGALFRCGEGGYVTDENGNIVLTWDDLAKGN